MSSTMSLMIGMNHALLSMPDSSALQEEDAGKYILKFNLTFVEAEEDDS